MDAAPAASATGWTDDADAPMVTAKRGFSMWGGLLLEGSSREDATGTAEEASEGQKIVVNNVPY